MAVSPDLKTEIIACLSRSGYLLESRLVRMLTEERFFVEPSIAMVDRRTGKSREVDMLAQYYNYVPEQAGISVQSHFVIEAVNNNLPLVLMTEHPNSPLADFEGFLRYSTTPNPAPFLDRVELYDEKGLLDEVRYSQYCALSRKKSGDDLMASHPDDLYASFLKLAEFVEHLASDFEALSSDNEVLRLWLWQAVLVVGGDLLVAHEDAAGAVSVAEVESGSLIFNFHVEDEPRTCVIHVVRERELLAHLGRMVETDSDLASRIHAWRSSMPSSPT